MWLVSVVAPVAAMAGAIGDDNWKIGVFPAALFWVAVIAVFWIGIGWSGRTRLAEVHLQDGILFLHRSHIFNRGRVLYVPLSETSRWKAIVERYGNERLEVAQFYHRETTYTLQIDGADYADLGMLNCGSRKASKPLPALLEGTIETDCPHGDGVLLTITAEIDGGTRQIGDALIANTQF